MDKIYDVIIIGAGPAGLTAAIYAMRAKLTALVIEKSGMGGGQILTTYEVDNYPGMPGIGGFELGMKFKEHADLLGVETVDEEVINIEETQTIYKSVKTEKNSYQAKSIILATGAAYAKLKTPGEAEFIGKGVSYCATCDGAFFRGKTVAVVGGGDVAVEDAIFLARACEKVYLIHRRDELRAAKFLQDNLFSLPNVEMIWDTTVTQIVGEEQVSEIQIEHVKSKERTQIKVDGVFVAVGIIPNTDLFKSIVACDDKGYIIASEDCATNKDGIFVAGDARTKPLRQIVTAVADGANAITSIQNYFISHKCYE